MRLFLNVRVGFALQIPLEILILGQYMLRRSVANFGWPAIGFSKQITCRAGILRNAVTSGWQSAQLKRIVPSRQHQDDGRQNQELFFSRW